MEPEWSAERSSIQSSTVIWSTAPPCPMPSEIQDRTPPRRAAVVHGASGNQAVLQRFQATNGPEDGSSCSPAYGNTCAEGTGARLSEEGRVVQTE